MGCAMFVLDLCHMGILLEIMMGPNLENGLLHHGLCNTRAFSFKGNLGNCYY